MSGLSSSSSGKAAASHPKVAPFRGPGRTPEPTNTASGYNDPIIITQNQQFIDSSTLEKPSAVPDVLVTSPLQVNSKRVLGENSIRRQVNKGVTPPTYTTNPNNPNLATTVSSTAPALPNRTKLKLHGPGGTSILSGIENPKVSLVSLFGGAMQCVIPSCWREFS